MFSPMSANKKKYSESRNVTEDLAQIFRTEAPQSCFLHLYDSKPLPKPPAAICPPTLLTIAENIDIASGTESDNLDSLLQAMSLTSDQYDAIESITRAQSISTDWKEQRRGRITASNMKRVFTRVQNLQQKTGEDPKPLLKTLMGYDHVDLSSNYAIKHGQTMEPHAKNLYTRLMKTIHKGFKVRDSGLVIHKKLPYLAASPDLVIECNCCGSGLCEIKCPYSCKDQVPLPDNWPHLIYTGDQAIQLSPTSAHMYQVQGQMACSGVQYCDFFVYTAHGHHLERIMFDDAMWRMMVDRFQIFFKEYLGPEILSGSLKCDSGPATADHTYSSVDTDKPSTSTGVYSQSKPVLTAQRYPTVYLCGMCGLECDDNTEEQSVQCKTCKVFFHFQCLNVASSEGPFPNLWKCSFCTEPV